MTVERSTPQRSAISRCEASRTTTSSHTWYFSRAVSRRRRRSLPGPYWLAILQPPPPVGSHDPISSVAGFGLRSQTQTGLGKTEERCLEHARAVGQHQLPHLFKRERPMTFDFLQLEARSFFLFQLQDAEAALL